MSTQQEVYETGKRPRRRAVRTLLLVSAPVALAAIGGLAVANIVPAPTNAPESDPVDPSAREVALVESPPAEHTSNVLAAVVAPTVETDDAVPQIDVSFAPEPEPASAPAPLSPSSSGGSGGASSSGGSSSHAPATSPSQSFKSYCSSPSSPYSAGGSVHGLLSAANKERARIGVAPMSWSGSLASAATSWSQSMAAKDSASNGGALAHNPNRPGGENVAVSGSSGGMSVGSAVNKAHSGWMYSGGHCRNVMNPGYSTMGAGTASTADGNAVYTTANFR